MRRFLSFLMASAILLAGLALAAFEIVRAEGIRPFLLVGTGLMIGAAGVWLVDELSDHGDAVNLPSGKHAAASPAGFC
jgi:hypothetical protein